MQPTCSQGRGKVQVHRGWGWAGEDDRRGRRGQRVPTAPSYSSGSSLKGTASTQGPAEAAPLASEAVGCVGDPVGRLLLGALGGAVGGEERLVSFWLFAVGDGPLRGFSRSDPVCCWKNEKLWTLRLGLQTIPTITFSRGHQAQEFPSSFLGRNVEIQYLNHQAQKTNKATVCKSVI